MSTTISGVGVKFSHFEKCPSTKIHVRMPMVEPSVSALITAALIGNTIDPNARNINSIVEPRSNTSINGALSKQARMLSCSRPGVPPTNTVTPLGGVIDRRSAIFLAASLRLTKPFSITRTELSFGWVVPLGPATHGLPAMSGQGRSSHVLLVKQIG